MDATKNVELTMGELSDDAEDKVLPSTLPHDPQKTFTAYYLPVRTRTSNTLAFSHSRDSISLSGDGLEVGNDTRSHKSLKGIVRRFIANEMDFVSTENSYSESTGERAASDYRPSKSIKKVSIKLFPLIFTEMLQERAFRKSLGKLFPARIWLCCIFNVYLAAFYWVLLTLILSSLSLQGYLRNVLAAFHVIWGSFVAMRVAVVACLYSKFLERYLEGIVLFDLTLFLFIFSGWSTVFLNEMSGLHFYAAEDYQFTPGTPVRDPIALVETQQKLAHTSVIINLLLLFSFYYNILLLDTVTLIRTRLTGILHLIFPLISSIPYIVGSIIDSNLILPVHAGLIVVTLYSSSLLLFFGRYVAEFLQRSMFLAWADTCHKLKTINEKLRATKTDRKISTPVEQLIGIIQEAQAIVSSLRAAPQESHDSSQLDELASLQKRLLTTLTETDNLYMIRWDETAFQDDLQKQFIRMLADDTTTPNIRRKISLQSSASLINKDSVHTSSEGTAVSHFARSETFGAVKLQLSGANASGNLQDDSNFHHDILRAESGYRLGTDWEYDILGQSETTSNILIETGYATLFHLVADWGCYKNTLYRFLQAVQSKYIDNPYHNKVHASMVCHCVSCLSKNSKIARGSTSLGQGSLLVAALCHDIGHPGRTNTFYQNSFDALAILYNDTGILENFHAAATFRIFEDESLNIFSNVDIEEYRGVRHNIIELILATDMRQHFECISKFRVRKSSPEFNILKNIDDRLIVEKMLMKVADLGHCSVDWDIHFRWSCNVTQEFYLQGDEEKLRGMRVSLLCDRDEHDRMAESQFGFLEFVVCPLLVELTNAEGYIDEKLLATVQQNKRHWKQWSDQKKVVVLQPMEKRRLNNSTDDLLAVLDLSWNKPRKNTYRDSLRVADTPGKSGYHARVGSSISTVAKKSDRNDAQAASLSSKFANGVSFSVPSSN